ncbi:MAG: MBL fold metallo-hydrolase [Chloroflexota bacterium]
MMKHNNTWFQTQQLDAHTWAINDNGHSLLYLVTGKERAALIDTGWGVGDLPGLVAQLTSLPLTVINTHGHPDHTFGNGAFERVYVTAADLPMIRTIVPEERLWAKENVLASRPMPGISLDEWNPRPPAAFGGLIDGDIFDLGDRTLQVIGIPGHTHGSICLLDQPGRRIFSGDAILPWPVWAHLDESTSLREYHRSLQRLQGLRQHFDAILPGHGDERAVPFPPALLDQLTTGLAQIIAGERAGEPEHTFAGDGLRCTFGMTGVIYRADKI